MPSNARQLVEAYDGRLVGVLEFVDGVPLTDADAAAVGEMLGRVHQASRTAEGDVAEWLQFLRVFESRWTSRSGSGRPSRVRWTGYDGSVR